MLKNLFTPKSVQKELDLLRQELNVAKAETIKVKTEQEMSGSEKERSMQVHIKNLSEGHEFQRQEIITLEKKIKERETESLAYTSMSERNARVVNQAIETLKTKNIGLEEMIKTQEEIINKPKSAINESDKDKQINNLKNMMKEAQKEIEQLKHMNFEKNQQIERLKGHGQN